MKPVTKFFLILMFFAGGLNADAYDPRTHREIAERVTQPSASSLDQTLKSELGLKEGIKETFQGISDRRPRTVEQLIGDGAFFEDVPDQRSLNHFHNPLRPWDQAGLRTFSILGVPLIRGQSSVLWQQNTSQDTTFVFTPLPFLSGGGNWSWQDARRHYLNALTRSRKEDQENQPGRDTAFAETFEALGRLTHLLQDASVPAHVRNDPHPRPLRNPDWYEDWVEDTRVNNSSLFQTLLNSYNKNIHRPPSSIFAPTNNTQAPVPIARLLDTDKFLGLNFSVLTDRELGISEYTNGNFLSRDTIFRDFDLPRQASLDPNFIVIEPVGSKFRLYYPKVGEGEAIIYHFVTEGLLHNSLKEALSGGPVPASGWTLDDLHVHRDYAENLLPRAVGYSAGLLDYFFRGKLDVDLVADPQSTDPTVVKLSGTNGSPDKLDGGTLTLYADDPVTDARSPVAAVDSNLTVTADPGQPVESAKFQINTDAERFLAVYKGKLGNEAPQGDFPGGVIGKILGGVRAESIFPEGDKRKLRTVDGVFELPSMVDGLEAIQWGDQENTFVGILPDPQTPGSQGTIVAFEVDRTPGSQEVTTRLLKAATFPFDNPIDLKVTVGYSQKVHFKEFLLTYTLNDTYTWNGSFYEFSRQIQGPTEAEPAINQTFEFQQTFSILLDQAHGPGGSAFTPYTWSVDEVAFDRQGRLLALVSVSPTRPDDNRRRINLKTRDEQCNLVENPFLPRDIFANFPVGDSILAVIDVEQQKVLGVSTEPTFSLSSESTSSVLFLQQRLINTVIGGESAGFTQKICSNAPFRSPNPNYTTVPTATISTPPEGLLSWNLAGRFRTDLRSLLGPEAEVESVVRESPLVYYVDDRTRTNLAVRRIRSPSGISGTFTFSPQAKLMRPAPAASADVLLLFPRSDCHSEGCFESNTAPLIRWSADPPGTVARALSEDLPASGFYILAYATSSAALIEYEDLNVGWLSTWIADLDNKKLQTIQGTPPLIISREYVLLDPKFLYNINDTRFHTLDALLRPTALPRLLASAPVIRPPTAAYHLIRVP